MTPTVSNNLESDKSRSKGKRKVRQAIVVSKSGNKSLVAKIERRFRHPLYEKVIKKYKKVYVHDENNIAQIGDIIEICESRPLSRMKRWYLVKILGRIDLEKQRKEEITADLLESNQSNNQ